MYTNIREIKRANARSGAVWFDPDSLEYWGTIVFPAVYGGHYFVTSDQRRGDNRRTYSVRRCDRDGRIWTVAGICAEFPAFDDGPTADTFARELADSEEPIRGRREALSAVYLTFQRGEGSAEASRARYSP